MLTRVLACGLMAAARLLELRWSQSNLKSHAATDESQLSRQIYPLIVAVHTAVIGGTLLFGGRKTRWSWLLVLLAVQPLRFWVLKTLGNRWNARGAVPQTMDVATDGPYAFVRHPNYSVIAVELAALPMAFGVGWLAFVAGVANAGLLTLRVREEERLLFQLSGYEEHFADKPRFVPFVF